MNLFVGTEDVILSHEDDGAAGDVSAFACTPKGESDWTPEKSLWAYTMLDALKRYGQVVNRTRRIHIEGHPDYAERVRAELEEWLESKEEDRPGAFLWMCHHLRLDPAEVRKTFYNLRGR